MAETGEDFYQLRTPTLAEGIAEDFGYPIPEVDSGPDFLEFRYPTYNLNIAIDRLTPKGEAEIKVWAGEGELVKGLAWHRINLMSHSAMLALIRDLKARLNHIAWDDVIRHCVWVANQHARQGEPTQEIWPGEDDSLTPEYLLEPVLYLGHPGCIFGPSSSLKSLFALVIAYVAQLPYHGNGLGLITQAESAPCLYLDWEDDPASFRRRWGALQRGFGLESPMPMLYRRMTSTLAESTERLQEIVTREKVRLVIVDSLGPAARGDLNDPEPAIRYHEALRKLGVTSLTLAHTSKDQATRQRTIYGSVFFQNLTRSTWEIKAEQEAGEAESVISLKQVKANLSKLHPPLGFRFVFADSAITITRADLRDTGLSGELPLSVRIKDLLRRGAMPVKDIAEALDANEGSVKTTVNRLAKRGVTVRIGESWGLSS